MINYKSLKKHKNIILIGLFTIAILGYMLGIRFANMYANKIIGLVICLLPTYLLVLVWKWEFEKKIVKVTLLSLLAVVSILSLLPLSFNLLILKSIHGGSDPSFEKVRILNLNSSRVVTYRTNGGATVDFGIIVRYEKDIFPGVYIKKDLIDIYHADDIALSAITLDSIKINSINFTSFEHRSDYMSTNSEFVEGEIIKI